MQNWPRMALRHDLITAAGAPGLRRRRAGLRAVQRRHPGAGLPSVFAALMLLGAAGLLTAAGIFIVAQFGIPRVPAPPAAAIGALASPSPPDATPLSEPSPTPPDVPIAYPTASVVVVPTLTPYSPSWWCSQLLGWSGVCSSPSG